MSVVEPGSTGASLMKRAMSLLTRPSATWDAIEQEPATIGGLYRSYVLPLAAIPAVCTFVGLVVFGIQGFGLHFRPSPVWAAANAITSYALNLAMVLVLALIIEALAPTFGGARDRVQAFKVAAYASTASWVAGVFTLFPALAMLALLGGLYGLYLLYVGLPKLMKTDEGRTLPYLVLVLIAAIVMTSIIGLATARVTAMGGAMGMTGPGELSGTVSAPGEGSVDVGKLEDAARQAEAAARQLQDGAAPAATDPETLKAYLPARIGGFGRTEVSASSGGVGGIQGSGAEGIYANGNSRLTLQVTDLGSAGALAGLASAFDVQSSNATATGYEKVGKVNGRMTQESYDRQARHGEYSVLVADRFMVQAQGDGVSMDELKAAVNAVDPSRLEALAAGG